MRRRDMVTAFFSGVLMSLIGALAFALPATCAVLEWRDGNIFRAMFLCGLTIWPICVISKA